ncbi:MAG: SagB/ThcOx family dehydrogenase [Proteobacteria bacterium]|nr:SagB/ThcOx family dehydrogenase [Pseudomonadota bacterium]
MGRQSLRIICCVAGVLFCVSSLVLAQDIKPIFLPQPRIEGGKPLMLALKDRCSTKAYSTQPIPMEMLSDLLWAAYGINRTNLEKRTAPSAGNSHNIDVYVLMSQGAYLYNAKAHSLVPVLAEDLRHLSPGPQQYAKEAPLHLLYVADYARMKGFPDRQKQIFFSACNTGPIYQNVYLYCASAGLGSVVRASMDAPALHKKLKLRDDQEIMLNQLVGYPKNAGLK